MHPAHEPGASRWTECDRLARLVVAGADEQAWGRLWQLVAAEIARWIESPQFLGRLALDEDHRREVLVRTWERLQEADHAKLRTYLARPAAGEPSGVRFRAWMRRVVKNIGIDYQRSLPEYARRRAPSPGPGPSGTPPPSHKYWRSIVTLASDVAHITSDAEGTLLARRMLAFLDESISANRRRAVALADDGASDEEIARQLGLPGAAAAARTVERARDRLHFRRALELWSQGHDDEDIARELALGSPAAAARIVNAAKEHLRRHFRDADG